MKDSLDIHLIEKVFTPDFCEILYQRIKERMIRELNIHSDVFGSDPMKAPEGESPPYEIPNVSHDFDIVPKQQIEALVEAAQFAHDAFFNANAGFYESNVGKRLRAAITPFKKSSGG